MNDENQLYQKRELESGRIAYTNEYVKPNKYFLCFGFSNFKPADLEKFHVTLIYFGEMNSTDLKYLEIEVDNFLKTNPSGEFGIGFSQPAMFGRDKDIPVLLPTLHMDLLEMYFLADLRTRVEKFQVKKDFPFNPHLTTDLSYFQGTVDKLYLCGRGYEVFKEWKL